MRRLLYTIAILFALVLTLSACNQGGGSTTDENVHNCTPGRTEVSYYNEPTCISRGERYVTTYCAECGNYMYDETEYEDYAEHTPGEPHKNYEFHSNCVNEGYYLETVYCTYCHDLISEEYKTEPTNDDHLWITTRQDNRTESTCTTQGSYEEVTYCYYCYEEFERETVTLPLGDHTPAEAVKENIVAPSCNSIGSYDLVVYCSNPECGVELSRKDGVVGVVDHTPLAPVVENEVAPTCTQNGKYDEVVYCDVCGEEVSRTSKTVPAAHTFDSYGICTVCEPDASRGLDYVVWSYAGNSKVQYVGIKGIGSCTDKIVVIPSIIDGKTVTTIYDDAFKNCKQIVSITIPGSVTSIGWNSFSGCTNLIEVIDRSPVNITLGSNSNGYVAYYAKELHSGDSKINNIDGYLFYAYSGVNYLLGYDGYSAHIALPESYNGETYEIHPYAFYNYGNIDSLTIPAAVTAIGENAFLGCSVKSATLSAQHLAHVPMSQIRDLTVTDGDIAASALRENKSIIRLTIGDGVTGIGDEAFYRCYALTSITLESDSLSIGSAAFAQCYRLIEIVNNSSLNIVMGEDYNGYIGRYAKDIHTGESEIEEIDGYLFYTYGSVDYLVGYVGVDKALSLPESYNGKSYQIHPNAFYGQSDITSVSIPNNVTEIGYDAFYGCSALTSVTIPNSVWTVGSQAFMDCTALSSIDLGTRVTKIEAEAFRGCTALTELVIPSNIDSIYSGAFSGCTALKSVTFEGSVSLGSGAFANCTALDSVHISDISAWLNMSFSNEYANPLYFSGALYVGGELLTELVVPNSVTSIPGYAFCNYSRLTGVTMSNNVTSLGSYAFYNCDGITEITIPSNVSSIGTYTFYDCDGITSITVPGCVNALGAYAFADCSALGSVTLSEGLVNIYRNAFSGCIALTSITVPTSVTHIYEDAFLGCNALASVYITDIAKWCAITFDKETSNPIYNGADLYLNGELVTDVVIPDGVTSIGKYAFFNCSSVTSVVIPSSVTSISNYAFYGCDSLSNVTLPYGITEIGKYAFYNCNITSVTIPNFVTSIGEGAFLNCDSLTSVTIPNSVTSIGPNAFHGCPIESVSIPASATSHIPKTNLKTITIIGTGTIADREFYNCTSLTSVTINGDITSIGNDAFYNCTSLTSITIPHDVTSIGTNAFSGCPIKFATLPIQAISHISKSNLKTVEIIGSGEISESMFYDCDNLTSVTIGNDITSIGASAFYDCDNLTSVTMGAKVKVIGDDAFYSCYDLNSVYISDVASWCEISFESYSSSPLYSAGNLYLNGELVTELVIPEGVTNIGDYAFYCCNSITRVTIPSSVTSIGNYAFSGCNRLADICISDITKWCEISFEDSSSNPLRYAENLYLNGELVTELVIPDGVTSIGKYAFYDFVGITSVTIPNSVTRIINYAFYGCYNLTSVTIGEGVKRIGYDAFYSCDSLTGVYISDLAGWYEISFENSTANPLYYAKNLYLGGELVTELVIPEGATSISDYSFYNYDKLTSVTIPNSVTSIGSDAFYGCPVEFASLPTHAISFIPKDCLKSVSVTGTGMIPDTAFYNCKSLTSVVIGESITGIGRYAFDSSTITSITIPNGVTSIGDGAFRYCADLTSVTIGTGVTSIGENAFYGCYSLVNVYISDIAKWCEISFEDFESNPLHKALNLYLDNELVTELVIPDSVNSISDYAFYSYYKLASLTVPDSVTAIGKQAFYNTNLTSVTIPQSVTNIGADAFRGCQIEFASIPVWAISYIPTSKIETLIITGTGEIPESAFYQCTALASVTINDGVTAIGDSAFYGCTGLTSIVIPDSVTSIGANAFSGCTSLTSVTIPSSATSIGANAFLGCPIESVTLPTWAISYITKTNLKTVVIIGGDTIDANAFNKATSLTSITISDSVTTIGRYAFFSCDSLTSLYIGSGVTSIAEDAFYSCNSSKSVYIDDIAKWCEIWFGNYYANPLYYAGNLYLDGNLVTDLVIPEGVTNINNYAFYDYDKLTSVTIPNSVKSIGSCAFYNCDGLTSVTIPDSVTSIGDFAFYSCSSLTSVTVPNSVKSIGNEAFAGCDSLKSVTIGNSATSIGVRAFYGCYSLASITVDIDNTSYMSEGGSLYTKDGKTLLQYAVGKTDTSFTVPDGVETINEYAFYGCDSLTSVTIPNSVKSIGDRAFYECDNLTSVTIGEGVETVGEYAFGWSDNITSVYISDLAKWCEISFANPDSNPISGANLYLDGDLVTELVIPEGVTSIGNYAFSGYESLTSVTIPSSVTLIGKRAFSYCLNLISITVDESNTAYKSVDGNLYTKDGKTLVLYAVAKPNVSFTIPDGVETIGDSAFYYCDSLTSITIPDSVTSIGEYAFYSCGSLTSVYISDIAKWCAISFADFYSNPLQIANNLYLNGELVTELVIPDGVTSIGSYAFCFYYNLKSVTISQSIRSIGENAFYGCENLVEVIDLAPYCYIVAGSQNYGYVAYYALEVRTGESKIVNVDDYLFYTYGGVNYLIGYAGDDTDLMLPDGYNGESYEIYQYAFYNRDDIVSVVIPDSVTGVGAYAFYNCDSLMSVTIGNGVTKVGSSAFYDCYKLVEVINHSSLNIVAGSWDYGCVAYYAIEVHMGESKIVNVGDYLFYTCGGVNYLFGYVGDDTALTLPESYNGESYEIYQYAFYYRYDITSVVIPNSVTTIGEYAFYDCDSLTSVTIPDSVTEIGNRAFSACSSLTSVIIPNSVTSIGNGAFNGCKGLTSVTIGDGVISISMYAFYGCSNLTNVRFSNPNGWWYSTSADGTNGTAVSANDLSDPHTAVKYLTKLYSDFYWFRA